MPPKTSAAPIDRSSPPPDGAVLGALFASSESLVILLDSEDRIRLFNHACEVTSGRRSAAVCGRPLSELVVAAEADDGRTEADLRSVAAHPPGRCDAYLLTHDRQRRLVRWSSTLIESAGTRPWVLATGRDISDERRTRDAVSEREARLQAILDTAIEGIITTDERGVIDSANGAAERIFGYRADELIGHDIGILMSPDEASQHPDFMRRYLATGEANVIGIGREVTARHKQGTKIPIDLAISEIKLSGKRAFVGMMRDISDRQRAEEAAQLRLTEIAHAARLLELGEMTSGIAHEVNQPLTAIVSFAEACVRMLDRNTGSPEVLRDALGQIIGQGQRAADIIRRLRQLMRKGETSHACIDIKQLVLDALALLRHEINRSRVEVILDLGDHLPAVLADCIQIEQVTINLVRNACEAMADAPEGARQLRLAARTTSDPEAVEVEVTDTGVGLSPEAEEKLFQSFFTTKPNGMGVGLAISRSIIEAHGGRLWAQAHAPRGTSFHFTLPLADGSGE